MILAGIFLFSLIDCLASAILAEPTMIAKHLYTEVATDEDFSPILTSLNVNPEEITKKNDTKNMDFDNYNAPKHTTVSGSPFNFSQTLVSNERFKNETGFSFDVSDLTPNIAGSSNNAAALSGSEVTGDFNGDGSDDLAIGVPFEDQEIGGSTLLDFPIANVTASGNDGNLPQNVLDSNLGTRWSSLGIGQFITADLGSIKKISNVDIAWYKGNERQNHFVIATSTDGTTFTNRLNGDSSGTTASAEAYTIPFINARYVKVTVNGNTHNDWASITELDILGPSPSHKIFDSGAVNVIYGSSKGLSPTIISQGDGRADQIWTQAITAGIELYDSFGYALATGDFNNDGFSDLAIGVREKILVMICPMPEPSM